MKFKEEILNYIDALLDLKAWENPSELIYTTINKKKMHKKVIAY